MRRARLLAIAVTALIGALIAAVPAGASYPGRNATISFVRFGGNNFSQLYALDLLSGNRVSPLVGSCPQVSGSASWSADGKRFAFLAKPCSGYSIGSEVFIGDQATGFVVQVTHGANASSGPSLSPDGLRLAYVRQSVLGQPLSSELRIVDTDGLEDHAILTLPALVSTPVWSPDGSRIAFDSNRSTGEPDLYTVAPDGRGLTDLRVIGDLGDWSPDGTRLVFTAQHAGISTVCADGTRIQTVTFNFGFGPASWSPDGTTIAFVVYAPYPQTGGGIWLVAPDGGALRQLEPKAAVGDATGPTWRALPGSAPVAAAPCPATAVDTTPPRALSLRLARFQRGHAVAVSWSASDAGSGIASYSLLVRTASPTRAFTKAHAWLARTTHTKGVFNPPTSATTACLRIHATDGTGNVASTREQCTTLPLAASSIPRSGPWRRSATATTGTEGAQLRIAHAYVRRLALVATRCRACGAITVRLGRRTLAHIDLSGGRPGPRQRILLPRLKKTTQGTITITVDRGHATIDALLIERT